jgi:DNA primase
MNAEQIRSFCQVLGIRVSASRRKGWVEIPCPLAEWRHPSGRDKNPSFGIQVVNGRSSRAHCFSCGFSGTPGDVILELWHRLGRDTKLDLKAAYELAEDDETNGGVDFAYLPEDEDSGEKPVHYFPEKWLNTFPHCEDAEEALMYCASRATPLRIIKKMDLRYDPIERRVCFPVRDFAGKLVGLHGRLIKKKPKEDDLKYRMYTHHKQNNPKFWLGEHHLNLEEPVVIGESVFDYSRILEVYQNTASPLTADFSYEKCQRLMDATHIITMFDGDLAGRKAAQKVKRSLPKVRVTSVYLQDGVDPGEMKPEAIKKLLSPYLGSILH